MLNISKAEKVTLAHEEQRVTCRWVKVILSCALLRSDKEQAEKRLWTNPGGGVDDRVAGLSNWSTKESSGPAKATWD